MKKLVLTVAAAVLLFSAGAASAACSQEEMQQKAMTVATQLQAIGQKDPARMQQIMGEMQQKAAALQADQDAVCKYYDELIEATK